MDEFIIKEAELKDLSEILNLQYLAYQSEAEFLGSRDIQPLQQTLDEIVLEYKEGLILKLMDGNRIIGSVRAKMGNGTLYVGKLMVHPDYRRRGFGKRLLLELERRYPSCRYELYTSAKSIHNVRLYESMGYREFKRKYINEFLSFVYMEK